MTDERTEEEKAMQLSYDRAKHGVNREDLEAMGERAVRDALNSGKYGHVGLAPFAFVSAWLADAEFVRSEKAEGERAVREESTARWARHAAYAAYAAAIIAAISIITTIFISK